MMPRALAIGGFSAAALVLTVALFTVHVQTASGPAACETLASLTLAHTTITSAQTVAAGAFMPPAGVRGRGGVAYGDLPSFCRVSATLSPSSDSDIRVEVWLPGS